MDRPLRLIVYDRTCTGRPARPGLTHSWIAGAWLYGRLDRIDAARAHLPEDLLRPVGILQAIDPHQAGSPALI